MNNREFTRYEKIISISDRSVRFYRASSYSPKRADISKRGEIKGFSRHSSLRLRDALSTAKINGVSKVFGVCLTLPWQVKVCTRLSDHEVPTAEYDRCLEEYKAAFNRFGVSFRRRFPSSASIFRHELQTRKIPHCHLVVYFSGFDIDLDDRNLSKVLKNEITQIWLNSFKADFKGGNVEGFLRRGVDVQLLDNQLAMFRYLADHTSKHKQAQLGYKGKQWGFLNRSLLVPDKKTFHLFKSSSQLIYFSRTVRRLSRFEITASSLRHKMKNCRGEKWVKENFKYCKIFGSKKSKTCSLRSVNFVSSKTSSRLVQYVQRFVL